MRITIDRSGCIGCGLCAETCPEVFRINEDGEAEVYAQPNQKIKNAAAEAAENCPVSIIHAEE